MGRKFCIFLFLLILSPVIIYFLWPSDESRIKKLIKEGAEAVEKEDLDKVMSMVSYNYQDDAGGTYLLVRKTLEDRFRAFSDIKVEYENLKIEVKKDSATAVFDIRVIATSGSDTGYVVGDIDKPAHLRLALEKEHAKWLIVKTEGLHP